MNLIEKYVRSLEKSLAKVSQSSKKSVTPTAFKVTEEPDTLHQNIHQAKRCSAPVQEQQITFEDLLTSQKGLLETLKAYLLEKNPDEMLLVLANAGSGKTTAGVLLSHWVHRELNKRVLYVGPRHNFFGDILQASIKHEENVSEWLEWLPRQNNMPDPMDDTCLHSSNITEYMMRGYNAGNFCAAICGKHYMKHECKFLAQVNTHKNLIYGQHQHVTTGHPIASKCKLLIGDENPMNAFIKDIEIPAKDMYFSNVKPSSDLGLVLHEIQNLAKSGAAMGGYLLWSTIGIDMVIDACKELTEEALKKLSTPRLSHPEDVHEIGYNILPILVPLMLREALEAQKQQTKSKATSDFLERIYIKDGNLIIHARKDIAADMPTHIIWFDATGSAKIYQELFGRKVRVIKARLKMTGKIIQVKDRSNSISSMITKHEASPEGRKTTEIEFKERAIQARTTIEYIIEKGGYKNPVIVCPMAMKEYLGGNAHFFGNRGTNAFEDCDVVIIVGTPMPPLYQIEKLAKTIWFNRMEPFNREWTVTERKYNFVDKDGDGWSIAANVFADPLLNEVLWQQREAEIIQSAHRGRILYRDIKVYLLTNLPVDELPPTELVSLSELMDAPEDVHTFKWHGVVEFAEIMAREQGGVSVVDLTEGLGIDRGTAEKYFNKLIEAGWEQTVIAKPPGSKGGRPKRTIRMPK